MKKYENIFNLLKVYKEENQTEFLRNKINLCCIIDKTKQLALTFKNKAKEIKQKIISEKEFLILINSFNIPNSVSKKNKITIKYKSIDHNKTKIKIFGEKFVEKNKKYYNIIINGKQKELQTYLNFTDIKYKKEFKIQLFDTNGKNKNLSFMFCDCSSLLLLKIKNKWNIDNVIDMRRMFYGCESLEELPDISNWNTKNVNNMSGLFYGCKALKGLPDISKWDTNKVLSLGGMFYGCKSLKKLPDISKWNTKSVINMNGLFYECESLKELPDISKWNINSLI